MSEAFIHPVEPQNETQKVQKIIYFMPVVESAQRGTSYIAQLAGVSERNTRKVLSLAECVSVERSGGPKEFRENTEAKTVTKLFDATTESKKEGLIPDKCKECPFSNFEKRTEIRNRNTEGCVILGMRREILQG